MSRTATTAIPSKRRTPRKIKLRCRSCGAESHDGAGKLEATRRYLGLAKHRGCTELGSRILDEARAGSASADRAP